MTKVSTNIVTACLSNQQKGKNNINTDEDGLLSGSFCGGEGRG